jgi:hypothetical protein
MYLIPIANMYLYKKSYHVYEKNVQLASRFHIFRQICCKYFSSPKCSSYLGSATITFDLITRYRRENRKQERRKKSEKMKEKTRKEETREMQEAQAREHCSDGRANL